MILCIYCNRPTKNAKYCSRSCSARSNGKLYPKRQTKRQCIVCGDTVSYYKHSRCKTHQQEYLEHRFDYISELTLQEYWNKKSLQNLHLSSKNAHIRGLARYHFKHLTILPCKICGYSKHVEICHIKPISDFLPTDKLKDINSSNNIVQLCPNCHWEFDNIFSPEQRYAL